MLCPDSFNGQDGDNRLAIRTPADNPPRPAILRTGEKVKMPSDKGRMAVNNFVNADSGFGFSITIVSGFSACWRLPETDEFDNLAYPGLPAGEALRGHILVRGILPLS